MNDSIKELVNENAFFTSILLVFKYIATKQFLNWFLNNQNIICDFKKEL